MQMLHQAECLVTKTCFHGDGIRQWATAVEKRYKDFSSRMSKYRVRLETKLGYPTIDQDVSSISSHTYIVSQGRCQFQLIWLYGRKCIFD